MFKKWKERDSDKDKKEKKDQAKRESNRSSKEKKSFTEVLAGFENSRKPVEDSDAKEKGHSRRSLSEKRRQERYRREELFRQQTAAEYGKGFGIQLKNGRVDAGLNSRASQKRESEAPPHVEQRPSVTGQYEVTVSKNSKTTASRGSKLDKQESIKVASGEEVTVNIGLSSAIMAGLDTGTRDFLAKEVMSGNSDLMGIDLSLPEVSAPLTESGRILRVKRLPIGNFGFALRRSTFENDKSKVIHLLEPLGDENHTGLMPGDRLVEVNGENVESSTRETIIDMISASGDEVTLRVITMPELADFSARSANVESKNSNQVSPGSKGFSFVRSSSMKTKRSKARTETEIASERAWLDAEKIWLNHLEGFSAGRLIKKNAQSQDASTCLVKLDHGGEVIEIDEEQISKANPPQYDRAEDLASLRHLNESACLHTLRQRYGSNLIHTYGGPNLLVVNPKEELGIYNEKVIDMFRGCKQEDMPPHIYAMAQTSYRNMQAMRMDQSIILLGRSGSGKTTNLRHLLNYYTTATSSIHSTVTSQKLEAAMCLLDSFGSAKTYLCNTASRHALKVTLEYDIADLLIGANVQSYLLEKTRVARRLIGESSFKIFYDLIFGCDVKLRNELFLDPDSKEDNGYIDINALGNHQSQCVDRWMQLQFALEALDIASDEAKGLWAPIAAIYHLGAAGVSAGGPGGMPSFANQHAAQKAASVLGTNEVELSRIIFSPSSHGKPRPSPERGRTESSLSNSSDQGMDPEGTSYQDALDGFVMGLYVETFSALIRLINRATSSTLKVKTTLQILDSPGFQDPISVHPKCHGASFEDLCFNYACEKLHWFLHFATFTNQLDRYNRENIDCNFEVEDMVPPNATIAALDKLNADRRTSYVQKPDPRGVFWILEDEATRPSADDIGLVEKIVSEHGISRDDSMVKPGGYSDTFKLAHLQRTVDVTYCTTGWLKRVKEHPTIKSAYTLLAESKKPHVADLYVGHRSGVLQVEIHRTRSVKKRSAHGPTLPAIKKNSACMFLKMQMDSLLETLRRTNCRFVHCFLPDVNAGVADSKSPSSPKSGTPTLDVPLLRKQFRSSRVLPGIRMYRQGYPEYLPFSEFRRRFDILLPRSDREQEPVLDEKQVVQKMVEFMELDRRSYRIGLSQIFFRSGSLAQLEDSRDEKLNDCILEFQAHCRGFIGRKKLKQLRIQLIAVKCLQRNIKKYMAVQNWNWWRLYTKVLPLLDVHRTEEELKSKSSELGLYKVKVEKLENENQELTDANNKLRKKVSEMSVSLSQVQATVANTSEILENETSERMRLEEEMDKLREEHEKLKKEHGTVQTEVIEAKVEAPVESSPLLQLGAELDLSLDDSEYKARYIALSEDVKNLRQSLLREVEEEIETLTMQKRQAEKQLAEEREEAEDCRRQATNAKRKLAKYNEEMEDLKLVLETSHIRNAELEKKQRKFDQEMNALREELRMERQEREESQRGKDVIATTKLTIANELQEKEEEIARLQREVDRFQQEFEDMGRGGFTGDTEVFNLKREKRDLELKIQEQEEELDEQAGQIQILEQAKLKLEMASQRDKQQFQKDLDFKDDEMEQMRSDHQRKMRQLEEQIEEEYREKNEAVKIRRDFERRLFDLQHSNELADRGSERKLRKELKKLRILYKDAKYALDSQASQNTDKAQLKQLRNQLEDLEFAKHIVLKSKKQLESDLEDLQKQLDEVLKSKQEVEEKNLFLSRENAEITSKIEDGEDEVEELIKKNRNLNSEVARLQNGVVESDAMIQTIIAEKDVLDAKVQQLNSKLAFYEETTVDKSTVQRLEAKIRELEGKVDSEVTLKNRLDSQVTRLKNNVASLQDERDCQTNRESRLKADMAKQERQTKVFKEELETARKHEDEQKRRREAAESEAQSLEEALSLSKTEINIASKRIRDLQEAIEREMAASSSDDDDLSDVDSECGSMSSRFSSSRSLSTFDRRSGHYDRSTRLRRRLTALDDESSSLSSPRKHNLSDDVYGVNKKYSRTNSKDSIGSYGASSSRYFNGSLDTF